jgi:hypothetical protein
MKQEQIERCGQIMAERAGLLFKDHSDAIMELLAERDLETEGERVQITVPMKMTVLYDQHQYTFEPVLELKKVIKESFTVEPATYNPLQPDLPGVDENKAGSAETTEADAQEPELTEDNRNEAPTKKEFYNRICGAADEPGPLTPGELDQYFASSKDWGSYEKWLEIGDNANIAQETIFDFGNEDKNRDGFVALVKSTLYPTGKKAEQDMPEPEAETEAEFGDDRCEACHPKFPELRCVLKKDHEGQHKMDICGEKHADKIRVCIKPKGHAGNHKYADLTV